MILRRVPRNRRIHYFHTVLICPRRQAMGRTSAIVVEGMSTLPIIFANLSFLSLGCIQEARFRRGVWLPGMER
jgi:hypothetical protein